MTLELEQSLDLRIEKSVYGGMGLARHEGQVVFVPRTVPGDRVEARVVALHPGFARATVKSVLERSSARRDSPCRFSGECGGCAHQEADYSAQLQIKRDILVESLARAGVIWKEEIVVRPSPEEGWRTRATFHVGTEGSNVRLGLHEEGTHRIVALDRCLQVSDSINRALVSLASALQARPSLAARVTDVELAEAGDGTQLVVLLSTHLTAREAAGLLALADAVPWATGFGAQVESGRSRRFVLLRGDPHVETTVFGIRLRAHVRSFFQVNRFLVEPLAAHVRESIPMGTSVLDLYAGVGLFAVSIAPRVRHVRAVERSSWAMRDARENARRARLGNLELQQADVLAVLGARPSRRSEWVILDPPRSGAGAAVVHAVAGRRPEGVVYVSCDPPTLARDLKTFGETGYRIRAVDAFDLFPDTFHVETVVRLMPEVAL